MTSSDSKRLTSRQRRLFARKKHVVVSRHATRKIQHNTKQTLAGFSARQKTTLVKGKKPQKIRQIHYRSNQRRSMSKPSSASLTEGDEKISIFNKFIETTQPILNKIPFRCAPLGTTDKCAVIVEPRNHRHLEYVIRNVSYFLDDSWSVLLVHGLKNDVMAKQLQSKLPNLSVHRLPVTDLKPSSVIGNSNPGYSQLLASKFFYELIPAENILIFQTDSILLRKGIDQFLEFDYIGAPWHNGKVGNGGLSFRKKSKMVQIINTIPLEKSGTQDEDVYFAENSKKNPTVKFPTVEQAKQFSVESLYAKNPLGIHAAYKYLSEYQIRELLQGVVYA